MRDLTKKEKLKLILEKVQELEISAYEISKKTTLTEAGIGRILNGSVKNPHESTLDTIIIFLENKVLGSNLDESGNRIVSEPKENYTLNSNELAIKLQSCMEESKVMMQHIMKLQKALRKNNISFEDYFDKD